MSEYDSVVLDIEGTITPITFVKNVLFPFVTNNLDAFLERNWGSSDLDHYIDLLRQQAQEDVNSGQFPSATLIPTEDKVAITAAVKQNIDWQMAVDRKIGALKAFQGFMWNDGYKTGELRGEVYSDVIPVLKAWQSAGKKIYIYSSGSVPAQKLIVGFSDKGDLTPYFSGYFDTKVGLKVEKASYVTIAREINTAPERILFVSDNVKEIQAAREAGYQVVISDRPGNAPLGPESQVFQIVTSFDQIKV